MEAYCSTYTHAMLSAKTVMNAVQTQLLAHFPRFMVLLAEEQPKPTDGQLSSMSPTLLIEKLWCLHLLETRSYAQMCANLVPGGAVIHHTSLKPHPSEEPTRMLLTMRAYCTRFHVSPPSSVWGSVQPSCDVRVEADSHVPAEEQEAGISRPKQATCSGDPPLKASKLSGGARNLQIFVLTLDGKRDEFQVSLNMNIEEFKILYQEVAGVPTDQQSIIYAGMQLEDSHTFRKLHVKSGATFHLVLKLRGC